MGCCLHGQASSLPAHPGSSRTTTGLEDHPTLLTSGLRSQQLRGVHSDKDIAKVLRSVHSNHSTRPVQAASPRPSAHDEHIPSSTLPPTSSAAVEAVIAAPPENALASSSMFLPFTSPVASSHSAEQANASRLLQTNTSDDMYDDSIESDGSCCSTRFSEAKLQSRGCSLSLQQANKDASTANTIDEDWIEIQDSLACQVWEFASVIRAPLECEEDLAHVGAQLAEVHDFVAAALPQLARQVGAASPAVIFQALLTNRTADMTDLRSTAASTGLVMPQSTFLAGLDSTDLCRLASSAQEISDLLRVKIGDDSDIVLARDVTKDCLQFLNNLQEAARRRKTSSWNLFSKIRSECS